MSSFSPVIAVGVATWCGFIVYLTRRAVALIKARRSRTRSRRAAVRRFRTELRSTTDLLSVLHDEKGNRNP